ncbi:bifunctional riboflavin kinase/FAD synthetase [Aureimonas mangrovi]|uniref:bifunctional riboflavin kinase/FAD synthetase n=1 Tax=Aureimonas mangrovi TaxID=2758041 RepID=UPI00163DC3D4|nr:bifunctional riboflavin kinase/FAD synthetase [Aureimonas mangrovi]
MSVKADFVRVEGEAAFPRALLGGVVAIGNFDGVHRGHQSVLETAAASARECGAPLVALTFEPHPRTVFAPAHPVPRLTPAAVKARLFSALGFDAVVEQPFDRDYAGLSAEDFIAGTIVQRLGARDVVVGFDFQFGARRSGDAAYLAEAGRRHGFGVEVVEAYDEGGAAVSSSRIRTLLSEGEADAAAHLLGYRWTIEGAVGHGRKVGRTLGYPTANMVLDAPELLANGIYAVRVRRADGSLHDGVASYGRRPTFDDGAPLFETYLFDFAGDLYGEALSISIFARLRGEERFDDVPALVAQMDRDAALARELLAGAAPLSALDEAIAFSKMLYRPPAD